MKRFLFSVALCFSLLIIGLFFFMPSTDAQDNVLPNLLNLPAPPPPNPFFQPNQTVRDENFFDKKNPPRDDAPIEDLLAYWKFQNQFDPKYTYTIKPSDKSLQRLMGEIEKKPETLSELTGVLPENKETADFVKRLYDEEISRREFESSWRAEVKKWLTYHSSYFSDELAQTANQTTETKEYVTNQDEVLALARVDWELARPLLERMLGNPQQPVSQTLARWAFYKHALMNNDLIDIERYRKELQETVENKTLQPGNRDLAMDAIIESGDFSGRDDWYYSLLEDETLYELKVNGQVYTGLTTILNHSPSDKYVEKMIELAGSSNQTIRNAAVRNLSTLLGNVKNPEIIKALLPWLSNPKWAKEVNSERSKLVMALRNYAMPESVTGLIAMLNEKEKVTVEFSPNANANVPIYPSNRAVNTNVGNVTKTQVVDTYPFRSAAIMALETQKSSLAVAPLRQILPLVETWERQNVVKTLLVSNGFTIAEQVEALEAAAKVANQEEQAMLANMASNAVVSKDSPILPPTMAISMANSARPDTIPTYREQPLDQNELKMILGSQLVNIEEVSDELVKAVIDRINYHDKKNPQIAFALRRIVQNWKGAAINSLMLRDLKDGKADLNSIVRLLSLRKELREKQNDEVRDVSGGSAIGLGISACLSEEANVFDAILDSDNLEAKTAMLGCARLIRAALPVPKVAENLKSPNKLLALAAERYLESEDSLQARQIVLSRHPNEAKILGARIAFVADNVEFNGYSFPSIHELFISVDKSFQTFPPYFFYGITLGTSPETEKKLQKEVKENQELFGIYAYDNNFIRIYKDKAVFSWQDDPARYRERTLSVEEFENLKNFLFSQRVDELPPFLSGCDGCESKELLMLGRNGGRRVFVRAEPLPPFFADLENIFAEMRKQPAQIHYYLEKDVAGLEVLFADENLKTQTLWKDGADFRLLIDDMTLRKQFEKEIEETENKNTSVESDETESVESEKMVESNKNLAQQKENGSYSWYKFDKIKLLETTVQPPLVEYIPLRDGFAVQPNEQRWKALTSTLEIRADQDGLYKISRGQIAKIRKGFYNQPIVTPNSRWAIATKYDGEDAEDSGDYYASSLVRVNLLTNKEFKVKIESDYGSSEAVAFVSSLNKVLVFSGYEPDGDYETSEREGTFFLLDADTGLVQPLKGEARPLLQQTFRPLQPLAASPDLFWTALPDRSKNATQFGIYNAKTLSFKPLLTIPQIIFESMNMWIDEKENKIYFVYEGQLLALPLPKNQ